jgi:murein DD-endopeptidase MepM/ murein hydrolase activator NlpD
MKKFILIAVVMSCAFANVNNSFFPLKSPVYYNGKIVCTSWYSQYRTENGKTYQYKALNYPAKFGTDIQASWGGIVIDTLIDGYEGATVTILYDNGLTVRYCHLSKQMVLDGPNSRVSAGDIIGKVGRSGRTTGSHLRIVVEKNGDRTFCNAQTWGLKYTDFYYSQKDFDVGKTLMYCDNK